MHDFIFSRIAAAKTLKEAWEILQNEFKGSTKKAESSESALRRNIIGGSLDHVNPVIRLPIEHGISMVLGLKDQTQRIVDSNGLIPGLTTSEALKSIQELADHSHKWHNEESTPTLFGIITDKLKALNHEMDELRVDVRKINTNREMKSMHEEIKSIRTSKISYKKSYPKSNIHPTNLKDTFEHYLKESCKRQYVYNEWIKKFMINTEMNLKDHDSSIKRLKENINHVTQLIFTHNLTNQECAIKLEPPSEKPTLKVETFAEKDDKVPIILRRPMLATAHARIDVFSKKISLEVRTEQITFDINERESPAVISPACVINNFLEINTFDEPRNLEVLLMSDDINRDLARLNDDSSGMFCNPNSNWSISLDDFVEMDDIWDNLDLGDLTNEATNSPVKPEF
nr:hypothetical protein [Tanacetum cinerariifolium]